MHNMLVGCSIQLVDHDGGGESTAAAGADAGADATAAFVGDFITVQLMLSLCILAPFQTVVSASFAALTK